MNQIIKKVTLVVSTFALIASLVGCASFQKGRAFKEYTEDLSKDVIEMEAFSIACEQLSTVKDYKSFLSGIKTAIGHLDKLIASAENRNVNISDTEIKDMDDSYVQALKDLRSAYQMVYEGLDEDDEKKMALGEKQIDSAVQNMKDYAYKMKAFTDKYNLGGDEDFNKIEEMLNDL